MYTKVFCEIIGNMIKVKKKILSTTFYSTITYHVDKCKWFVYKDEDYLLEKLELELEIPRVMSRSLSLLVSCTGFTSITQVVADEGVTDVVPVVTSETE